MFKSKTEKATIKASIFKTRYKRTSTCTLIHTKILRDESAPPTLPHDPSNSMLGICAFPNVFLYTSEHVCLLPRQSHSQRYSVALPQSTVSGTSFQLDVSRTPLSWLLSPLNKFLLRIPNYLDFLISLPQPPEKPHSSKLCYSINNVNITNVWPSLVYSSSR